MTHTIIVALVIAAGMLRAAEPAVILDEDFTRGAFSAETAEHWQISAHEGIGFKTPNDRDFSQALARTIADGSTPWAGATYAIWDDTNGDGGFNDGEMRTFRMNKRDDVCIVKFRAFSDVASSSSPWIYGVEVAMMEWRDDFCDDFHYCHDLQWEARQVFLNNNTSWQALQLIPNVENIGENAADYPDGDYPYGVRYAHFESNGGKIQESDLDREYDNMVIWRPLPDRDAINFELWGECNADDYIIDTAMNSTHDPDNPDALFDHVQITFFRNYNESRTSIIRDGIPAAQAQIGICNLHLGITKRADFTVDYRVDQSDAAVLSENMGGTDSMTLLTGDATNDNATDIDDANALIAFWSDSTSGTVDGNVEYNANTGEMFVDFDNVSFFSIECLAQEGFESNADLSALDPEGAQQTASTIGAFTGEQWTLRDFPLGAIAPTGLQSSDFRLTINKKGSGKPEGIAGTVGVDTGLWRQSARRTITRPHLMMLSVYSPAGALLHRQKSSVRKLARALEHLQNSGAGIRIVRITALDKTNQHCSMQQTMTIVR